MVSSVAFFFFFFTTYLLTTHKLGSKHSPYLWPTTCLVKNLLSYLSTYVYDLLSYLPTYVYDLLSYRMGLPRWNPILTHLIDVHLGAHFRRKLNIAPYKRWFFPLRFILLECEWGHPSRQEAKWMISLVPFVFSLVFGLMCFDRIVWYKPIQRSYTLLRKILNLVVQGASWTMRAKSMGICG